MPVKLLWQLDVECYSLDRLISSALSLWSCCSILKCFEIVVKGDVLGSLVEFDKAIELDTRQKACKFLGILIVCFLRVVENVDLMRIMIKLCGGCDLDLWQRGLSLYYVDRY